MNARTQTTRASASPPAADGVSEALAVALERGKTEFVTACYENQFAADLLQRFPNPYASEASRDEVERWFLAPLLDVLIHYARTGDPDYRHMYLSERRRYAPHRHGSQELRAYFAAVLPFEERLFTRPLDRSADAAIQWLQTLHAPLVSPAQGPELRLLAIGDCLLNEIQTFLLPLAVDAGTDLDIRYYYFSGLLGANIEQDGIAGTIKSGGVDLIAASYLTYEGIPLYRSLLESADRASPEDMQALVRGIMGFMSSHLAQVRELTDAPILLHNASGLPLTRWRMHVPLLPALSRGRRTAIGLLNAEIRKLSDEVSNCFLIDEYGITREHGLRDCARSILPPRIQKHAQFHPAVIGKHLADAYLDVMRDILILRKTKLLLVDFDNTLWHGVMADGPVEHFGARQQLLKRLSQQGIVLAALSKNDPANIRWEEMQLAAEDFVSLKINWNLKPNSIREIAAELSLGLDSFVLVDDNPVERELVRVELPSVQTLDATEEGTWRALERLFRMPNTRETSEARARTQMYREQAKRAQAVTDGSDYPSLMRALDLRGRIGLAKRSDLDRAAELVQRTNQFNTTTIRYSRGQLEEVMASPDGDLFVGELSDKFGDLGVVIAAVVKRTGDGAVIENFVMSCRAMGFGMEHATLAEIIAKQDGRRIIGRFVPSSRNQPASNFFAGAGFKQETENGEWMLEGELAAGAPWIRIEQR